MSQDQLIMMSDIMSMSASEVQLNFQQDQNEDSISYSHRPRDIGFESQQQPLQDDESVAYSSASFSSPIQQHVGDQENLSSSM